MVVASRSVKVADEVWIATALLHKEKPDREDFAIEEIVDRARKEGITETLRPGVRVHATLHCVANRPPNPGRYRMLFATDKSRRRLYRPGDAYDSKREGTKTVPKAEEIPEPYRPLLDWYRTEYLASGEELRDADPILALRGLGRGLWESEGADEYVRRLRGDWE